MSKKPRPKTWFCVLFLPTNWNDVWIAGFEIFVSAFDKDVFIDRTDVSMTAKSHGNIAFFVDNL